MKARVDRRLQVGRAEMGRSRQQHYIDAAVEQRLVAIEAREAALGRYVDLVADALLLLQRRQARFEPVGEHVGHRGQTDIRIGLQGLSRRAGAAPPAADQADSQRVVSRHMNGAGRGCGTDGTKSRRGRRGPTEKLPPRCRIRHLGRFRRLVTGNSRPRKLGTGYWRHGFAPV